ncbi:hypothetical protein [Aeromicrobium sp.]|uniref:hypothetical protein n=1 Tax=Aeromicrobium sp. TaxID=1871063 RepID=UPI003C65A08A
MKHPSAVIAAVIAALLGAGSIAHAADYHQDHVEVKDRILHRGAVVRLGPSPSIYTNSTHAAVGVTGLSLRSNCYLILNLDWKPGEKVIAAIAEEDESVSLLDVQAGISGGGTTANIYLYRNGRRVCANDRMFGKYANLWVSITSLAPESAPTPTTAAPMAAPTTEPTSEPTATTAAPAPVPAQTETTTSATPEAPAE